MDPLEGYTLSGQVTLEDWRAMREIGGQAYTEWLWGEIKMDPKARTHFVTLSLNHNEGTVKIYTKRRAKDKPYVNPRPKPTRTIRLRKAAKNKPKDENKLASLF